MKLVAVAAESPHGDPPPEVAHAADVELMRLVAAGDRRAQRLLASRLAPRGLRLAQNLVSHGEDAKDVVQDGLLEIFRSAASYRGDSTLERWADRVFVRRSLRYVRRVRDPRARRELLVDAGDLAFVDAPPSVSTRLDEYVARLSADLQRVILLRFTLGYTVPEIAELMDASPNTTKKRLMRALARLRAMMDREALR